MLTELLKEESQALEDFYKCFNNPKNLPASSEPERPLRLFEEAAERSQKALQECQLIESLDQQLRRLTGTIDGLKSVKRIKELETRILAEKDFSVLIPMVSEWRSLAKENSNHSANVASFINETLPEIIDKEIETVLLCWIDDPPKSIDQEAFKILESANYNGNGNPLPGLFASFPLCKLKVLLNYHERLGHLQRVKKSYPDRLLNRFYDILSQGHDNSAPFSVGLIESLVSEKAKFATRISCILEATNYFIKLHAGVIDIEEILMEKCGQILRQIRRDAKKERNGYTGDSAEIGSTGNNTATYADNLAYALAAFSFTQPVKKEVVAPVNNLAQIDSQLNEICLIISSLSHFGEHEILISELEKWKSLHIQLEEVYLFKGIQRAIEMDQIVVTSDFPVSSCVDDIFYIFKASQKRTNELDGSQFLIPRALKEFFLSVLRRHLESTVQALKPLTSLDSFKPSRDLISTLVLLNNLVTIKSYWLQGFNSDSFGINEELESLFKLALQDGLYGKVLRREIVLKELKNCNGNGEEMFIKIHSILNGICTIFKVSLNKSIQVLHYLQLFYYL